MLAHKFLRLILLTLISACSVLPARAGDDPSNPLEEKVPVELIIRGLARTELFILRKDRKIFLPASEVFNFLRIYSTLSPDRNKISGFFMSPDSAYTIDIKSGTAQYKDRLVALGTDKYVVAPQDLYLESTILRDLFNIESVFDSRRLTVTLKSSTRLPIEIITERERNRARTLRLHQIPAPAVQYSRSPLVFGGTRLDWRINSSAFQHALPRHTYSAGLGGQLIGGDFEGRVRGTFRERIRENNWSLFTRYPFFDSRGLRQIIFNLNQPDPVFSGRLKGVEISNQPAPRRLLLGSEVFTAEVPSSEDAELFEGGVLRTYVKSPHDSVYDFQVEMPYGISDFEVRRYDQWGSSSRERVRFNVPQFLIPPHEVQYSIRGGQLTNFLGRQGYGRVKLDYGASEFLSLGGEVVGFGRSGERSQWFPGINATARIGEGILGEFSFSPLLSSKITLNALFPSQAAFTFSTVRYNRNSVLNISRVRNQYSFSANLPISFGDHQYYLNAQGIQTSFEGTRDQTLTAGIAGYSGNWRYDASTSAGWSRYDGASNLRRFWTTRVNSSFRLPLEVILAFSSQYDHTRNKIQDIGLVGNRAISSNLLLTASYTHTFEPSFTFVRLQLLLDLPFMRFEARTLRANGEYQYDQSVSGSVVTSRTARDFFFEDRQRLGRGALSFRPFLDENGNGVKEQTERYLPDVVVKSYGPKLSSTGEKKKEGLLVRNAEAYQQYIGYFPVQNFEDPHWVPRYTSVSVMAEPNIFKPLELPIVVGGLVSGRVVQVQKGTENPVEGVTVKISNAGYTKSMRSFSTGEFNFVGVPPGIYTLSISTEDLEGTGLRAEQTEQSIEVHPTPQGDVLENLIFRVVER